MASWNSSTSLQSTPNITKKPVTVQKVWRRPQGNWYEGSGKEKRPYLLQKHSKVTMDFQLGTEIGLWRIESGWHSQRRLNSIVLGHMLKNGLGKSQEKGWVMIECVVMCGGGSVIVWGHMLWDGPRYACRFDCRMDGDHFVHIWRDKLQESLAHYSKSPQDISFQHDNNFKYTCKGPRNSSQNMDSLFNKILNNLQTLIQLIISGNTSKRGSETTKPTKWDVGVVGESGGWV